MADGKQLSFPWCEEGRRKVRARRARIPAPKASEQFRLRWRVRLPRTRGDCAPGAPIRASGIDVCRHWTCRHNLIGELSRRPAAEAEAAMVSLLLGEAKDSCALDVAERGGATDEEIGRALGSTAKRITQISAEALYKMRGLIAADETLSVEFADELAERKRGN